MVRIPQHNDDRLLNDIAKFVPFLESLVTPREWKISVDWCSGEKAKEVEETSEHPWAGSHSVFCELYRGIYQTIDGSFILTATEGLISLKAFDSSYWEIVSEIPGVEDAFNRQYGTYEYGNSG